MNVSDATHFLPPAVRVIRSVDGIVDYTLFSAKRLYRRENSVMRTEECPLKQNLHQPRGIKQYQL